MVLGSSSDEEPDLAGIIIQHQVAQHQQERGASQDSDLPAWIASHTPVRAPISVSSDTDSDEAPLAARRAAGAGAGPSSAAAAAAAGGSQPGSSRAAAAAAAAAAGGGGGSSRKRPAAAQLLAAAAVEGNPSHIQLILPEKLLRNKVLVELEPAPHQATELAGDAGAVGRIITDSSTAVDGCFKVDLKGVLYQATVLPLAGTALVANIGPTEAKVEAVLGDFVRLSEEASYLDTTNCLEGGGGPGGYDELMADDEDNYQFGDEGKLADKGGGKKAAAAAAKRASKAAGGKAGLKAAGGVKKRAAAGGSKGGSKAGARTPSKGRKPAAGAAAKKPAAAGRKPKAAAAAATTKARAPKAAAAAAAAKPAKQEKKAQSSEDDDDDSGSDWSMD